MSLPKLYLKHFRKRSHESYPLWEIGTDITCGAVGTFNDQLFSPRGHLSGKVPEELLVVDSNKVPGKLEFSSDVEIDFGAGLGVTPAPGTEVNGEIRFGKSGGVYFEAVDLVEHRLRNLGDLLKHLRDNGGLDPDEVMVGHVWTFASATLLVTESANWKLSLAGQMPPAGIKLASGDISLDVKSGTGERRTIPGTKPIHPMSVRVFGRRGWWSGKMIALSDQGGASAADFVDVTEAHDADI